MKACTATLSLFKTCGGCQQFWRGQCGLHLPECNKGEQSYAEDCMFYQPEGCDPAWMTDE